MNAPHGAHHRSRQWHVTQKITTYLWFNGNAEEAVEFYTVRFRRFPGHERRAVGRRRPRSTGQRHEHRLRAGGPAVHRAERRTAVHVHAGDFALRVVRIAGGSGRTVDEAPRRRRQTERVRVARRPLRPVLADHSDGADRVDERSRPEGVRTRRPGHDGHAEDRHRRPAAGARCAA